MILFADTVDPRSIPEFVTVLDAIRRGGRRSSFRLLDVACRRSHRLAEVYATAAGPVILGVHAMHQDAALGAPHLPGRSRVVWSAAKLIDRPEIRASTAAFPVQCRCRSTSIPGAWVAERLTEGHPRAVWSPPSATR